MRETVGSGQWRGLLILMAVASAAVVLGTLRIGLAGAISVAGPSCSPPATPVLVPAGTSVTIPLNCTDPAGQTLVYDLPAQPPGGQVSINASTGEATYAANPGFTGPDAFSFTASAPDGITPPISVPVNVGGDPTGSGSSTTSSSSSTESGSLTSSSTDSGSTPSTTTSGSPTDSGSTSTTTQSTSPSVVSSPASSSNSTSTSSSAQTTASSTTSQAPPALSGPPFPVAFIFVAPPSINARRPIQGAVYTLGEKVIVIYSCSDSAGPGLTGCTASVGNGRRLDTSTLGKHSFTVTGSDRAGQSTSETITYTVVPTTNHFTAGRARAGRGGVIHDRLRLPGPGTVVLLAEAWNGTRGAPLSRRSSAGHRQVIVRQGGVIDLSLPLNRAGRRLLHLPGAAPRAQLTLIYTPVGGKPRRELIRLRHL